MKNYTQKCSRLYIYWNPDIYHPGNDSYNFARYFSHFSDEI